MQYHSYEACKKAAIESSIRSPGYGFHVSWIEDDAWEVSIFQDYESQEYALCGNWIVPEYEEIV